MTARGAFVAGVRDVAPVVVGIIPFGLVAGAAAVDAGLGVEGAVALSTLVFAGASQLATIDLLARDAPTLVVLATVVIINLRMAMYSAALSPVLAYAPTRRRVGAAYLLVDQAFALTVGRDAMRPGAPHALAYYLGTGTLLWANWQAMTVVGALIGSSIPDWLPLSATIPLVFLALLVPAMSDRPTVVAGVVSGVVATLGAGLPANAGLLVGAFSGIAAGTVVALRAGDHRVPGAERRGDGEVER